VHDDVHFDAHHRLAAGLGCRPRREVLKVVELEETSDRQTRLSLVVVVLGVAVTDSWHPHVQLVSVQLNW